MSSKTNRSNDDQQQNVTTNHLLLLMMSINTRSYVILELPVVFYTLHYDSEATNNNLLHSLMRSSLLIPILTLV